MHRSGERRRITLEHGARRAAHILDARSRVEGLRESLGAEPQIAGLNRNASLETMAREGVGEFAAAGAERLSAAHQERRHVADGFWERQRPHLADRELSARHLLVFKVE